MIGCPKCGCPLVNVRHNDEKDMLRCVCPRCEYKWDQKPLDQLSPGERAEVNVLAPESDSAGVKTIITIVVGLALVLIGFGLLLVLQ